MSKQIRALTVDRNKRDSCYHWSQRVCRYHTWRHLVSGNPDRSRGGRCDTAQRLSVEDRNLPEKESFI